MIIIIIIIIIIITIIIAYKYLILYHIKIIVWIDNKCDKRHLQTKTLNIKKSKNPSTCIQVSVNVNMSS